MGLLKKIFKRKLTPEQQEEQSRREKEWAEKCYRAGENFGARIGFADKVQALNDFANRYPRTFFGIITVIVLGSLVLNLMFTSVSGMLSSKSEEPPAIERLQPVDPQVKQAFDEMQTEMESLADRIDSYLDKDTLTHADSLEIKRMLLRVRELESFMQPAKITE
ncbi:MAG: hypothetical protein J6R54_01735 [Bacteroidaceae bacterium]|nr:hypothetical protein [Bacteroidaceae bacterium]